MLKLMYITNRLDIALAAEKAGVDRIWVDLETLGKEERQRNLNTVKSQHSVKDIRRIAPCLSKAEMLVRVNPWNTDSVCEIEEVMDAGAQILMLPYWKSAQEANNFLSVVSGRCKTILLLETKEAVDNILEVIKNPFVDEIHIGLNDLQISFGFSYMFEPFANGLLDKLSVLFGQNNICFGIGGIGQFGVGFKPSPKELLIEHIRLGSSAVILSRSFCNYEKFKDVSSFYNHMCYNIKILRGIEMKAMSMSDDDMIDNKNKICEEIFENIAERR